MEYCGEHAEHNKTLATLERAVEKNTKHHEDLWIAIKEKISVKWVFALIPVLVLWIGFQWAVFSSLKTVEKDLAVLSTKVELTLKDR